MWLGLLEIPTLPTGRHGLLAGRFGRKKCAHTLLSAPVNLYHWLAHSGSEVDLVIERDGMLWPLEIKSKANINSSDIRGLNAFRAAYPKQCGPSIVVASTEEPFFFSKEVIVLPYSLG